MRRICDGRRRSRRALLNVRKLRPLAIARCQRGHLAGAYHQVARDDLMVIFEEAPLGRSRRARSIFVVSTSVTGAKVES